MNSLDPPPDRPDPKPYLPIAAALALATWLIWSGITIIRTGIFRHKEWELTGSAAVIDGWIVLAIGSSGVVFTAWRLHRLWRSSRRDRQAQ